MLKDAGEVEEVYVKQQNSNKATRSLARRDLSGVRAQIAWLIVS